MMRRFEVLLPSQFNDGADIAETCLRCFPETLMDVIDRFGALSLERAPIEGVWMAMGHRYDDELLRLTIDVPDTDDTRRWMTMFKTELLTRFQQLEIYITSYPIDVL
jgi:hypothetical protein